MKTSRGQLGKLRGHFLPFPRQFAVLGLSLLALVLAGCSVMHLGNSQPKAQVSFQQLTNAATGLVPLTVLQSQIMRFADAYVATIAQACDEISTETTLPEARLAVLRWKLGQATSIYIDATGENPAVNALDMLVLVSVSRMVTEDYGLKTYGDSVMPLVEAQRKMETSAWKLASGVLKPTQQIELRGLIEEWRQKNPNQVYVGSVRFREFVAALGKTPTQGSVKPTSIFSLLYLDPLAGLDPTAAAIQETRGLAERAMYYGQRMPTLLNWQMEVLAYQLAAQPESQQLLADAERISLAADAFAKVSQQLPQLINDQRQAAIQQVLDGLTDQGNKSRVLLTDTRSTLDAASVAATNLNAAIQSLTAFVQYVSPTNASPATDTNSRPFNVLDYGTAASQIGAAATNLNTLLAALNESAPQVAQLSRQTANDAGQVVWQAFWLGLILIGVLLVGAVVAALVYRRLVGNGGKPAPPGKPS